MNVLRTIGISALFATFCVSCALVNTSTYPSRTGAYFGERPDGGRVRAADESSDVEISTAGEADRSSTAELPVEPADAADTASGWEESPSADEPAPAGLASGGDSPTGPITLDGVAQLVPGQETQIVWTISPNRRYVFLSATRTLEGLSEVVRNHQVNEPIHIMLIDDARGRFVAALLVVLPSVDVDELVRTARRSGYQSASEVTSLEEVIVATRNLELIHRTGQ